ncbi:hypothetical protein OKS35_14325 [Exiguobacterium sp. N5]|uniref:hypothetical protein n=1 Tax=Exiguobacterium sp. N5 TaxID=2990450 RepID=UPI0021F40C4B|nr:hypothetical protein [Exiguobacterium sp. N5]MCV9901301.1 hypothetical protein [Exiguobacterium sp. N5]
MVKAKVIEVLEYDTLAVGTGPNRIDQKSFDQLEQIVLQMNVTFGDSAAIDFL